MARHPVAKMAMAAIALPIAAKALSKAGQSMQARRGHSRTGSMLERAGSGLNTISGRRRHSFGR